MKYTVTLKGWGHESVRTVEANTAEEAIAKVQKNLNVTAVAKPS